MTHATNNPPSDVYDCIVIGGGPAGATCSTLLADHGRRVLVLEQSSFPRHHIGESLMPQTYWTFKRLGVLERLKCSGAPEKQSVQFVSASAKESQPYYFTDRDPHESSITWQVRRDDFDRMMLDNAKAHGVDVWQPARVRRVLFESDKAVGVEVIVDDELQTLSSAVIVDASGQSSLIARQLNLRYSDSALKRASIYAYYRGARRDEGRNAGATIVFHTPSGGGWFWFIPLSEDVASIGIVASPSHLFTGRGNDPLATLEEEIDACPAVAQRLADSERVSGAYVTRDFSYRSRRMAGDGWVLIGDAFGFLDPVYSSGVMLALKSGEFAADAIHDALAAGDVSVNRLGAYDQKLVDGMQLIRQLVYAFYNRDFSFARFQREHPEHTDRLVRILIGDIFNDDVGRMFDTMRDWIDLPEPIELERSGSIA